MSNDAYMALQATIKEFDKVMQQKPLNHILQTIETKDGLNPLNKVAEIYTKYEIFLALFMVCKKENLDFKIIAQQFHTSWHILAGNSTTGVLIWRKIQELIGQTF